MDERGGVIAADRQTRGVDERVHSGLVVRSTGTIDRDALTDRGTCAHD
jgi:hypothetical protein